MKINKKIKPKGIVIGIDASRNRSGGAKSHLIGILENLEPFDHGIHEVHVWTFQSLLDSIPDKPWIIKHNPIELEHHIVKQIWWQANKLVSEVSAVGCDILFTTDASTFCRFKPMVVLSQDMLSYEHGMMKYFGYTKARLRLLAILLLQNLAFRFADGIIFLTRYAARVIQKVTGRLDRVAIIPHGVDPAFKQKTLVRPWPGESVHPIRCLYVSNAAMYKHQWWVVRAIAKLRQRGHNISLILAGGGAGRAQQLLDDEIAISDPKKMFVVSMGFVRHDELPSLLANADLFVFASSCENLPVTLLEAMAVGLPIACSNRGPMPEVLEGGGVYFDPKDPESIAAAVERIITDADLRVSIAKRAKELSEQYSWARCAAETWDFLKTIARTGMK